MSSPQGPTSLLRLILRAVFAFVVLFSGLADRSVAVAQTVNKNPATMAMIQSSYQADLGRAATQPELAYWGSVPLNDSRVVSRAAFQRNNIGYLRSSPAERQRIVLAAFGQTWGVNLSTASPEYKYWEGTLANGEATYTDLMRSLGRIKAANANYRPGMNPPMRFTMPPPQYAVASSDGSASADTTKLVSAFDIILATFQQIADAGLGVVRPPANGGTVFPPNSPLPGMSSPRPPPGLGAPFVLAATPYSNPNLSFCLDTGSFSAGSPVVAALCHGGNSQLFTVDNMNRIVMTNNPQGALCLDGGDKNWPIDPRHKQVMLNPCSSSRNQQWYVNTIAGLRAGAPFTDDNWHARSSGGQIQNIGTGQCVDIQGGAMNTQAGNPVIMYDCQPGTSSNARPWNQVFGAGHIMTTGAAYVFFRYNPPPGDVGHVSWAVQLPDGSWEAGGEDGFAFAFSPKGSANGDFRKRFTSEADLRAFFVSGSVFARYDQYIKVPAQGRVNTAAVFSLDQQNWDYGYVVLGNNCMDDTYRTLVGYGVQGLISPQASGALSPVTWMNALVKSQTRYWLHN